jgi:multiple sugar transport system substrate-binding protein
MKNPQTPLSRTALIGLSAATLALATACSSSGGFNNNSSSGGGSSTDTGPLTVLIGSSGPAETAAVQAAAAAYTKQSGVKVTVIPAQNLQQQVSQGFASGKPADVFYLDTSSFQNYAKTGALYAYASKISNSGDFYPALTQSFTYNGTFYCVPKDWSTLGLAVNDADWSAAGLTTADVPTTWDQLETVAKKLTTGGRVGLTIASDHAGVDEFLYQNGGTLLSADKKSASFDSPQNQQALAFVKKLLGEGALKFPSALNAGWNGEAFGKNAAAMTIVGNWLDGSMKSDFPNVKYTVYPLPAGPSGTKATLSFTNCWGIPAKSAHRDAAVKLVDFLASGTQQMAFAKAFGVMPSRQSVKQQWTAQFPADAAFLDGSAYAQPDLAIAGGTQVISDYDSKVTQLGTTDPATLLSAVQKNFEALIQQNQ